MVPDVPAVVPDVPAVVPDVPEVVPDVPAAVQDVLVAVQVLVVVLAVVVLAVDHAVQDRSVDVLVLDQLQAVRDLVHVVVPGHRDHVPALVVNQAVDHDLVPYQDHVLNLDQNLDPDPVVLHYPPHQKLRKDINATFLVIQKVSKLLNNMQQSNYSKTLFFVVIIIFSWRQVKMNFLCNRNVQKLPILIMRRMMIIKPLVRAKAVRRLTVKKW